MTRRLILFDVDGTLVDSQASIVAAMSAAFEATGLPVPDRQTILAGVGLSLDESMVRLVPEAGAATRKQLVQAYRGSYFNRRVADGAARISPLFPGARDLLSRLSEESHTTLGVATGKSRRGLDALIDAHELGGMFATRQSADDHPSKPHPSMVLAAMENTGFMADETFVIGDTSFDMQMARAAGAGAIGVGWGYHAVSEFAELCDHVAFSFEQLSDYLGSRP